MKERFISQNEHRFTISIPTDDDPNLIICPHCKKMAKVYIAEEPSKIGYTAKAVCLNCGFNKTRFSTSRSLDWVREDPSDSYFNYPLWLKMSCCGHSLWAFNKRHLDFLERYVRAELREQAKDGTKYYTNSSLSSRLPKWMKSYKNRKKILVAIQKLKVRGQYIT